MTGSQPVLLLLSARRRVIVKARELGLDAVHIEAPTMSEPELRELCRYSTLADLLDVTGVVRLARSLYERFGFAGVTSNHEPACVAAEAIALDLGLRAPGSGPAVLLRDKIAMRTRLAGHDQLGSAWAEISGPDDIRAAAQVVGYPMIVKPSRGSASLGVVRVDGPGDLDAAADRVRGMLRNEHRYHELLPVTRFLAEPFVEGTEYSVESFSRNGCHEAQAVVRKITEASFVEVGHITPAPLDSATVAAVVSRVFTFLDVVGLKEGPAHTEVIVGRSGVHIVESHTRTGGDEIFELVQLVSGRDPELEMLAHFAGLDIPGRRAPVAAAVAKIYLVAPSAGRIRDVEGIEDALAVPGVRSVALSVSPGDRVGPVTASWDRLGAIVATGDTPEGAWQTALRARNLVKVHLEEA